MKYNTQWYKKQANALKRFNSSPMFEKIFWLNSCRQEAKIVGADIIEMCSNDPMGSFGLDFLLWNSIYIRYDAKKDRLTHYIMSNPFMGTGEEIY